jgi:UDP-N-acetylmuramoylalanine--D-glutamate ligase
VLETLKNKKVAVWGSGIEGKAVLEKLNKTFPNKEIIILSDENAKLELSKGLDVVIRSPGVSIYKDEIIEAKKDGVVFITEKTLFYSEIKNSNVVSIGITGTKGKTTTSIFFTHILQKMGYKTILTGNIGIPTINLIDEAKNADFVITELSSYQCSDLLEFPKVGILLNLYPEHIDWHKTHENYYKDKKKLLSGVEIAINECSIVYENKFWWYNNKQLWNTKNMKLLGDHNYKNLSFVFTAIDKLGIDLNRIKQEYLDEFTPIEHRMEIIDKDGIKFVNDSIGTTPETALACFETFREKNIYSILGGFDRQQDYSKIARFIQNNNSIKFITVLGQTASRIKQELKKVNFTNYKICQSLKECIDILKEQVKNNSDKNAAIILSPSAPSYDMYKNFEYRGNEFKKMI